MAGYCILSWVGPVLTIISYSPTEKYLPFSCKEHFNCHKYRDFAILTHRHLAQEDRLGDCWTLCSFYVTSKQMIITSTKQWESQPSPKPKCPVFTFQVWKKILLYHPSNLRKSKMLSFSHVLSRNANSSHLLSEIIWFSTDGKILLKGRETQTRLELFNYMCFVSPEAAVTDTSLSRTETKLADN